MGKRKEYLLQDLHLCFLAYYNQEAYFDEEGPVPEDVFSDAGVAICEKVYDEFKQVTTGKIFYLYDTVPTIGDYFVQSCFSLISLVKPERIVSVMDKKYSKEQIAAIERKYIKDYMKSKYGVEDFSLTNDEPSKSNYDSNWKQKMPSDTILGSDQKENKPNQTSDKNKTDDQKEDGGAEK